MVVKKMLSLGGPTLKKLNTLSILCIANYNVMLVLCVGSYTCTALLTHSKVWNYMEGSPDVRVQIKYPHSGFLIKEP